MEFRTLDDLQLEGRRVFMRVDFNVPLDRETASTITSDTRIRRALPTLQEILAQRSPVVLASHLGRPNGRPNPRMSLAPVALRLSELLGQRVRIAPDCVGPTVTAMADRLRPGEVLLLENLRFHRGEQANDGVFAGRLASLAEAYVNDAFGTAHRAHASTVGVAGQVAMRAAGRLIEKELKYLSMATLAPRHPYVAIIGGAKITGKIDVIVNLLGIADKVLIGGAMTYTFLKALGRGVGASLVENDRVEMAARLLESANGRIVLPVDHVVAQALDADAPSRIVGRDVPGGWMGLDIGPETVRRYCGHILGARMIVWNGPMGVFELSRFAQGTMAVAQAVEQASEQAVSIVGGGDSERAIRAAGLGQRITHISTGGGASLEFLGGNPLPGVAALGDPGPA